MKFYKESHKILDGWGGPIIYNPFRMKLLPQDELQVAHFNDSYFSVVLQDFFLLNGVLACVTPNGLITIVYIFFSIKKYFLNFSWTN